MHSYCHPQRVSYQLFVVRSSGDISEQEWAAYVDDACDLTMTEVAEATNPATQELLAMSLPGLAVWDGGATYWLARGSVVTGADRDDALARFALIAAELGGVVEGEEGETYSLVDGRLEAD